MKADKQFVSTHNQAQIINSMQHMQTQLELNVSCKYTQEKFHLLTDKGINESFKKTITSIPTNTSTLPVSKVLTRDQLQAEKFTKDKNTYIKLA